MNNLDNMTIEQIERLLEQKKNQKSTIAFVDVTPKGVAKPTLDNSKQLFAHYGISIRHNEMTKEPEINIPCKKFHSDTEMNAALAYLQDLARGQDLPVSDLMNHVTIVANENAYHPVRDWIDSFKWDGKDRLPEVYAIIDSPSEMKETLIRKWLLSGVAALYDDNFSCEGVLCLYGAQAIGKTSWIQYLLPRESVSQWVSESVTLAVGNKDSELKALGTWITELGELDSTFKKSDIEALKGWITQRKDVIRPPYERKPNKYSRRTICYATINTLEFLQDDENRRFWALDVEKVHPTSLDRGQLWAQIKQMYFDVVGKCRTPQDRIANNEWGWFLTPDERAQLTRTQHQFKTIDPIEELLDDKLVPFDEIENKKSEWLNSTAILMRCGVLYPTKRDINTAAKYLRRFGFRKKIDTKRFLVQIRDSVTTQNTVPKLKVVDSLT